MRLFALPFSNIVRVPPVNAPGGDCKELHRPDLYPLGGALHGAWNMERPLGRPIGCMEVPGHDDTLLVRTGSRGNPREALQRSD